MKSQVKSYRMYENEDANYKHLYIDLFPVTFRGDKPDWINQFAEITLKWQQSKTGELAEHGWYGLRIESVIKIEKTANHIEAMKYLNKLLASFETFDPSPEMVLSSLRSYGFKRIVWANHYPISEVDHGKTIWVSQINGRDYGKIFAFTESQAINIAQKFHGTDKVRGTGEKIDFDTNKFS